MKEKVYEEAVTEEKIKENLKAIEEGKPLTMPLAVLNGEFKKRYKEKFGEFEKQDKSEVKARRRISQRKYYKKPEVKARRRAYNRAWYRKKLKIPKSRWRVKNENRNNTR